MTWLYSSHIFVGIDALLLETEVLHNIGVLQLLHNRDLSNQRKQRQQCFGSFPVRLIKSNSLVWKKVEFKYNNDTLASLVNA